MPKYSKEYREELFRPRMIENISFVEKLKIFKCMEKSGAQGKVLETLGGDGTQRTEKVQ